MLKSYANDDYTALYLKGGMTVELKSSVSGLNVRFFPLV